MTTGVLQCHTGQLLNPIVGYIYMLVYVSIETTCMHDVYINIPPTPSRGHRSLLGAKKGDQCAECWSIFESK